jgi:hypothetical protein
LKGEKKTKNLKQYPKKDIEARFCWGVVLTWNAGIRNGSSSIWFLMKHYQNANIVQYMLQNSRFSGFFFYERKLWYGHKTCQRLILFLLL